MENAFSFPTGQSDPELIVAAIRQRRITLGDLSHRLGLPAGAVSAALRKPYAEAELKISQFLETPAATLWPERYNSDGTRKQPQPPENYRPRRRFRSYAPSSRTEVA
ncbi:hypothetical protein B5C34_05275 [Pacificimonas flava]|uniref:Ner winged helix-turn-helix DNA-binding domain-containing protein n=2 Tax=Pacificimonas TaxID=1960290 RepID=A0A219B453_9SPHN|nr:MULTISPECIES: helix-turn-helix domain-containing protein [Pacificimonas]MBZ6377369.1 helix-turn-helix domain-containing protein [Pacificimonas aurantium]OWV32923.1 hypothetical protein B5C34_05275 [Pacificimonas flava]